jgi:hypothetical protein
MLLEVLEVEQFEGDAGLSPLGVQVGAVRDGPMVGGRRRSIDAGLQRLVGEGVIGVAKAGWNLDQLRARARDSLAKLPLRQRRHKVQ